MLERSMLRYSSELSLPSHKLPISALVPEMICNKLFNSLAAFETDSFETDLRGGRGDLPSGFTAAFCSNRDAFLIEIIAAEVRQSGALEPLLRKRNPVRNWAEPPYISDPCYERASCRKPPCRHR